MVKLSTLYVISDRVNQKKIEKILVSKKSNLVYSYYATGSANQSILDDLGISNSNRVVVTAVIIDSNFKNIVRVIKEKLSKSNKMNTIYFTVPISSVIGTSSYKFLSNDFGGLE